MQQNKVGELKSFKLFGRFSLLFLFFISLLYSSSFENFKNSQISSFEKYKDEKDIAFGGYLKQQWEEYEVYKGKPLYEKPKPKSIFPAKAFKSKSVGPKISIKIKSKQKEVKKSLDKIQDFIVLKKSKIKKDISNKNISFNFFGSDMEFDVSLGIKKARYYPQNQKGVTTFFDRLASSEYENLILNINTVKKTMKLNDWGVYLLVTKISENIFSNNDERKLLSWFIFNKLRYAVRVGLVKKHIVLMHYSKKIIYSMPNYSFNNKKFYVISKDARSHHQRVYSYKQDYPDADKPLDLSINSFPDFMPDIKNKTLYFKQFGKNYSVSFNYNKNIIDFMATYPQADYETYFNAPLENETYKLLASDLKKHLDGKQISEAINFVLHFVQNSFKYQRDDQQFGREKVMFAQETLFYDKSDCEDRAVLFAYLVKELFGVSVVGLKYKDHMATAIYIPIKGDSVKFNSKRFVIADPTYINANIGKSMPKYKSIIPQSFIRVR